MRSRSLLEVIDEKSPLPPGDTYERVRRTLDEAIAELEQIVPTFSNEDSAPHRL